MQVLTGVALRPGRGLSVSGARVVLVSGRVAATWTVDAGIVVITPLRGFTRAEHTAVTPSPEQRPAGDVRAVYAGSVVFAPVAAEDGHQSDLL
ncbi:hypothetical protein GCM10020216_031690 [Nonomuraea helvata]